MNYWVSKVGIWLSSRAVPGHNVKIALFCGLGLSGHHQIYYLVNEFATRGARVDFFIQKPIPDGYFEFHPNVSVTLLPRRIEGKAIPKLIQKIQKRWARMTGQTKPLPLDYFLTKRAMERVKTEALEKKFDYCIGLEYNGLFFAQIAAQVAGCPFAFFSYELAKPYAYQNRELASIRHYEAQIIREADLLIIQDAVREREYMKALQTTERPQDVLHFPVSLPRVSFPEKPRYWHEKFGLPADKKIVLNLGSIHPFYLIDQVVSGVQTLPDDFVVIVHGMKYSPFFGQVKKLDRNNRVIYSTDYVDIATVPLLAASADIGLAFYTDEDANFCTSGRSSYKIAFYMQAGVPMICSAHPTFAEVVNEYHNGVLLSDLNQLPNAVAHIMENYAEFEAGTRRAFDDVYLFDPHFERLYSRIQKRTKTSMQHDKAQRTLYT